MAQGHQAQHDRNYNQDQLNQMPKLHPAYQYAERIYRESFRIQCDGNDQYGISGLLGNKCLELYNKPLFILVDKGESYLGSMRSVGYGDFMKLCNETGLAELHGHEEASGIEIKKENFEKFINTVNKKLSSMEQTTSFTQDVDCLISLEDLTRTLVDKVKAMGYD